MVTRGIKHESDRFINDLQAQYFPYAKDKVVQLGVKPMQLWELVLPEDSLPTLLKTLGWEGQTAQPSFSNVWTLLRKALKAKKIPKMDLKKVPGRIVYRNNIGIYPIGIKEDKLWDDGELKGYEML